MTDQFKKMKKTFNEICKEVPLPKILQPDSVLPHYFDMMWDLKKGYQILESIQNRTNPHILRALADFGFDASQVREKVI